ncbi:MAG: 30S ribosomal protein S16 [Cyclobacteriaceae bacterium]
MPVKIRLARRGRKKQAMYDIVIADSRSPRDGKFIEKIGTYNPNNDPATINLNDEKAFDWVMKGAQPTDTVKAMLSYRGIMMKKHLQIGVLKGAITQEEADKRFETWAAEKEAKVQNKVTKLTADKDSKAKAKLAAEKKVSDARAEAIAAKKKVAEDALVAEVAEASADEAEKALEEEGNEAVAEAPVVEEKAEEAAPAEEPKAEEAAPKEEAAPEAKAEEAAPAEEAPKADDSSEEKKEA